MPAEHQPADSAQVLNDSTASSPRKSSTPCARRQFLVTSAVALKAHIDSEFIITGRNCLTNTPGRQLTMWPWIKRAIYM